MEWPKSKGGSAADSGDRRLDWSVLLRNVDGRGIEEAQKEEWSEFGVEGEG